jgi:hypothetical protein
MKSLIGLIVFAAMFMLVMPNEALAIDKPATSGPQSIKGDLLKIDGEYYTVQNNSGHDVRVHVDKTTKLDGAMKTGDNVDVQVTEKGGRAQN